MKTSVGVFWTLSIGGAILALTVGGVGGTRQAQAPSASDACYVAQDFVTKRLRAPATAQFPSCSEAQISPADKDTFVVTSYVDSQNGFSALLRTDYTATVHFSRHDEKGNDWWTLKRLDIN